jgi:hypothetical protein
MAKTTAFQMGAYVAGYDLSGDIGAVNSIATPVQMFEVPNLDKLAMERLQGRKDGSFDFQNWFNDATSQEHTMASALALTDIMVMLAMGAAVGAAAYFGTFKHVDYPTTMNADGSVQGQITGVGSAYGGTAVNAFPPEWGVMLTALSDNFSSSSSSSSKDDGASTSAGIRAMIQPISLSSGTPTVVIEDSTNDSTWVTLVSFGTVAVATPELVMTSGTINRYMRITTTGTFSNLKIAVAYRRGTAVDDVAYA